MECGVELAATEFPPSYRRATVMQAALAALGLVSSVAAWLAGATFWWLVAGALLGSVIPFTLIVILPTNKQLLSPTLDKRSAETGQLLARWGALHAVRSVLSTVALLLFLYLAIFARAWKGHSGASLNQPCPSGNSIPQVFRQGQKAALSSSPVSERWRVITSGYRVQVALCALQSGSDPHR
jgi:Domain of unknown function (DUF1772)